MPNFQGILQFLLEAVELQLRLTIECLVDLKARMRQFTRGDQLAHYRADTPWTGPSIDLLSQLIPLEEARRKHHARRRSLLRLARAIRSTLRRHHVVRPTVEHYIGRMERLHPQFFTPSSA